MSNIRFPASLRPIVNRGYSQTRGSNIWRNDVQGGLPRQGRDTYFEPVPISITLVVSSLGRQAFLSFLNNIHGGADSFVMVNDTGYGLADHQVMITSTISDTTQDGLNWVISFTATAERTAIQEDNCLTANLPDLFGCYGDGLNCFLNAYGTYMTTFPRVWEPNVIARLDSSRQYIQGMSYSRAGTASYFDGSLIRTVADNIPRFEPKGLLIESGRTNLLTQSATFQTWNTFGSSKASTGPVLIEGTPSTEVVATATSLPRITQNTAANSIVDSGWALSFIMRAGVSNYAYARVSHVVGDPVVGGQLAFYVNLTTAQVTTAIAGTQISLVGVVVTNMGDWLRISLRFNTTGLSRVTCYAGPSGTFGSENANIGDSIYIAHAQLERFAATTSPIITTTDTVSRLADSLILTVPGATRVYREFTAIGSTTDTTETVAYTGTLTPQGSIRVIEVLND